MKKFYKVKVFEKEKVDYSYKPISDCKLIGEIIVIKEKLKARELLTGFSIDIVKEDVDIVPNIYKQDLFGRDLYINIIDFNDKNLASKEELNAYIDNYDSKTFCMQNEFDKCRKVNIMKRFGKK